MLHNSSITSPHVPSFPIICKHFSIIFQPFTTNFASSSSHLQQNSHHFPIIFPSFSHHFPIIFPSFSHHFPIIFPSFLQEHLQVPHAEARTHGSRESHQRPTRRGRSPGVGRMSAESGKASSWRFPRRPYIYRILYYILVQCEAPKIAKLVNITSITMVYHTYNYS
jgi:hypothetical protein